MSTTSRALLPPTPGDDVLNNLYTEVWAGYAPQPESYDQYNGHSAPHVMQRSTSPTVLYTQAMRPPSAPATGPGTPAKAIRRLPPTPGTSSTSPPAPSARILPDPRAIPSPPRNHIDSRRLPNAPRPPSSNGAFKTPPGSTSPSMSAIDIITRSNATNSAAPPSGYEQWGSPGSHDGNVNQSYSAGSSTRPTAHPSPDYKFNGTYASEHSVSSSSYQASHKDLSGIDEYHRQLVTSYQNDFSGFLASDKWNQKQPLPQQAASDHWHSSQDTTSQYGANVQFGGSVSDFSMSHVSRHPSGRSDNRDIIARRPSSQASAPLHCEPSTGSYGSPVGFDQSVPSGSLPGKVDGFRQVSRRMTDVLQDIADYKVSDHFKAESEDIDDLLEEEEDDDDRFVNFSLLSHLAVKLRDKVPRGTHVKGSIPYPRAFTGKDIVSTIQFQIQRELNFNQNIPISDRRAALQVARSLQSQLFFYEVEWGGQVLQDGVEDVYMFLDDQEGGADVLQEELPTGVVTALTRCYSTNCRDGFPCYSYGCPRKGDSIIDQLSGPVETFIGAVREEWTTSVPPEVLISLPESEINRQIIIHKLISKEEQYVRDLDIVESVFINPLKAASPPVISPYKLEDFINEVFGNILDLRECNRRLLEIIYVRQREQGPIIQRIGDVFLSAANDFIMAYSLYIGHHPQAEKKMREELDKNPQFRLFLERCSRQQVTRPGETLRLDLRHFLNRPSEHMQKYPVLLDAIFNETVDGNPDGDYLLEAIEAFKRVHTVSQLRIFQLAMGRGPTGSWEWHDLVSPDIKATFTKEESKRQSTIFELIKGEMSYVKDLENIDNIFIRTLRNARLAIIPADRLEQFIQDTFHNFAEIHAHHRKLVDILHEIQREEHPRINSITAAVFDAALNFREAYMEYIPNYPIAEYRLNDEMANNDAFRKFVEECVRHPDAHRLDMKNFVNRPIPRLLRYELLLKGIMDETPIGHDDRDTIPQVIDVIKALGKETEPGVLSAKQKVQLWRYNSNLVFKPGETIDMDLLSESRSLLHTGKLLRQSEGSLNSWNELFIILFDNYLVMTKPREKDGIIKYHVTRRPIPLDLLTLLNFSDPASQKSTGILRNLRSERHADNPSTSTAAGARAPDTTDSRTVYPCTIRYDGRAGGTYVLYADSAAVRTQWKNKLVEAVGLHKVVQESNKVFEVEILSQDTFHVPPAAAAPLLTTWNDGNTFTGRVTCSIPFNTSDGRRLIAIGCAEGVWIGLLHDSRSLRRVLHLKNVTQCAMLEDFGIFLVLADKCLYAYHIQALVPSSPSSAYAPQTPQKLNTQKDVQFFSIGVLHGRTLVIYMKKRGVDSVFHAVEPVVDKINEKTKATTGTFTSRLGLRPAKTDWFRSFREFSLPVESYDLVFLKARLAILCSKGFEIMDLPDYKSVTIPQREDPRLSQLIKRCESCRPVGMFRTAEDEFLLCYDEFGLFVNKRGDPSRSLNTIEWEGKAERVALHSPYILIFDSHFIEIRHLSNGRLAQIMPGNDIRCIWDGRGLHSAAVQDADASDNLIVQDARIHVVRNVADPVRSSDQMNRSFAQEVFELIPTIPLYLPGSLASPSTATYLLPSPPRSP